MFFKEISSPIGLLRLWTNGTAVVRLDFCELSQKAVEPDFFRGDPEFQMKAVEVLNRAETELAEYFQGKRTVFTVPLAPEGTPFQRKVWEALRYIPFGETVSYGEIARRIGSPGAARAVGMANHRNPIPIFIPCHRVIGASGKLVGYSSGLERKSFLIGLEGPRIQGTF